MYMYITQRSHLFCPLTQWPQHLTHNCNQSIIILSLIFPKRTILKMFSKNSTLSIKYRTTVVTTYNGTTSCRHTPTHKSNTGNTLFISFSCRLFRSLVNGWIHGVFFFYWWRIIRVLLPFCNVQQKSACLPCQHVVINSIINAQHLENNS